MNDEERSAFLGVQTTADDENNPDGEPMVEDDLEKEQTLEDDKIT